MDHSAQAEVILNIEQENNNQSKIASSCCSEYLTNSLSDNYNAAIYSEELNYPLHDIGDIIINRFNTYSQRVHDPPDLQLLNSTFLI